MRLEKQMNKYITRLLCNQKKKKTYVFILYIYNFYFDNLIYKWIKQFEI